MSTVVPCPPPPAPANTCAVIVTFHPDEGLPKRVRALTPQVARVVVVDNGSGPAATAMLDALERAGEIQTVRNAANLGIATALNQGLEFAARRGDPWVITLDQDSTVLPEFAAILFQVYREHPEPGKIGIIGSSNRDPEVDLTRHFAPSRSGALQANSRTVITSGGLTSVAAWQAVGPFRDAFFIDCVDEEFCLRLRRHGFLVVRALTVGLIHRLGEMSEYRLLGWTLLTTNHSALRRYYITRNAFTLIAASLFREPLWAARKLQHQGLEWLGILAAETSKGRKVGAVLLGLWHALTRRAGPLAPERAAALAKRPAPTGN